MFESRVYGKVYWLLVMDVVGLNKKSYKYIENSDITVG